MDEETVIQEEIVALENEFRWVLKHEVHNVLKQLSDVLTECVMKFPITICGIEKCPELEKFILHTPSTTPSDQVKVVVGMIGECINQAEINLKLPRPGKDLYQNSNIREDAPWRLTQIQDSANHLQMAMNELSSIEKDHEFKTIPEVDAFLSCIMASLQRSRSSLVNPKKRTLEELHNSKQMKSIQPPLPNELALSFYIQGFKLIFGAYHVINDGKGATRFSRYQAECAIPWINEVLVLLTMSMQMVQQLKDKVNVFDQFSDISLNYSVPISEEE